MATKIIVSYDGTENDHDALALGRLLAGARGALELAYVRHAHEVESGRERLAEKDAEALLAGGAEVLGFPDVPRHVVISASTPEGLRSLAVTQEATSSSSARSTAPPAGTSTRRPRRGGSSTAAPSPSRSPRLASPS